MIRRQVQSMDSAFLLDEARRIIFLRYLMQCFGCNYICLWSYQLHPTSSSLRFLDGCYHEEDNRASSPSSSVSYSKRLFDQYCYSVFVLENNLICVPGQAFKNCMPYMEVKEAELSRMATNPAQMQFYQEARIKTAVFMGCRSGEIEMGMSSPPMMNMDMEMRNWFPDDFSQHFSPQFSHPPPDRNRHSSSSSQSMSMDSPEYPQALLFDIPATSYIQELGLPPQPPPPQPLPPQLSITTKISTTDDSPVQDQTMQTLSQIRSLNFPSLESEHDAMTRAILAVLTASSPSPPASSASSSYPPVQPHSGAFRRYIPRLVPSTQMAGTSGRQSMLKRSLCYFKNLYSTRGVQELIQGSHPTVSQLHHMISERKRREKLNESFHALRTLLPPGSKKDKASILIGTREYLNSLKAQVSDLTQRNQALEAQSKHRNEGWCHEDSSNERVGVMITDASEPTPDDERNINLQVTLRSESSSITDLVIRIMEFLKQLKNVSLMSMEAEAQMGSETTTSTTIHRVILRLKIQGNEWDQSTFQEAIRRVVADLAI